MLFTSLIFLNLLYCKKEVIAYSLRKSSSSFQDALFISIKMFLPGILCIFNPLFEKFYPLYPSRVHTWMKKLIPYGGKKDFIRKDNEQYSSR